MPQSVLLTKFRQIINIMHRLESLLTWQPLIWEEKKLLHWIITMSQQRSIKEKKGPSGINLTNILHSSSNTNRYTCLTFRICECNPSSWQKNGWIFHPQNLWRNLPRESKWQECTQRPRQRRAGETISALPVVVDTTHVQCTTPSLNVHPLNLNGNPRNWSVMSHQSQYAFPPSWMACLTSMPWHAATKQPHYLRRLWHVRLLPRRSR
jgi:hypothetical protein